VSYYNGLVFRRITKIVSYTLQVNYAVSKQLYVSQCITDPDEITQPD